MVAFELHPVTSRTMRPHNQIVGFESLFKALPVASFLWCAVGLQGCVVPEQRALQHPIGDCEGSNTLVQNAFELKISGITYTRLQPSQGTAQTTQNASVVIPMHITNLMKQPAVWSFSGGGTAINGWPYTKEYWLWRNDGSRFNPNPYVSSILKTEATTGSLNPGAFLAGSIGFDVPPGDYEFELINRVTVGIKGIKTLVDQPVLRCRIGSV